MAKHWIQDATDKMEKKGTKGSFSRYAHRHNESTKEAADKIHAHPKKYSPALRKKANFARNVS